MPKKPLVRTALLPYHVFARTNNRNWFAADARTCWRVFLENLDEISMRYSVWVHAFVLMSNHFHLIATTPNANLDRAMNYLMREVAKSINQSSGTINHLFGGSYKWSLLPTGFHYAHAIKYVYRNPVVAGMCARVEDYPYSTLAPLTSGAELKIPIVGCEFERHPYLAQPTQALLEFFNSPYNDKEAECIRRGIRKRKCIFVPLPGSRRLPPSLDSQSYPAPF